MPDALIEVLSTLPLQVAIAWGFTRVLPMRHAPLFVVVDVAVVTALSVVDVGLVDVWVGLALLFAVGFVLPFFLYQGSRLMRAVVVVAANVCDNLVHGAVFAVWAALMRAPVPDDMDLYYEAARASTATFAVAHVVGILVAIGLFLLLSAAMHRFRGDAAPSHGWISFGFLLTQVALVVESLIVLAFFEVSTEMALSLCLLLVGCLGTDWVLLGGMSRYERLLLERARGDVLERQLESSLASYGAVVTEMERTGRVRHDLRNHLQAVEGLAASGQVDRALDLVSELRRVLGDDGEEDARDDG